jgi:hypothetical protein
MTPDHAFTPGENDRCTTCKLPEGNRLHTAADVIVNGTTYGGQTPRAVIDVLESARANGQRLRLHWGDTSTGQDWGDVNDVTGRIGRSMGPTRVPILLHNTRSTGGGAILDHCIVKITTSAGGHVLYQHPTYTPPTAE